MRKCAGDCEMLPTNPLAIFGTEFMRFGTEFMRCQVIRSVRLLYHGQAVPEIREGVGGSRSRMERRILPMNKYNVIAAEKKCIFGNTAL